MTKNCRYCGGGMAGGDEGLLKHEENCAMRPEEIQKAAKRALDDANSRSMRPVTVDGELGPAPVSRPCVLHIVADTMKIRQAAHEMCNVIYTKKGIHPDRKIRLEAKDLTAILSAAIHRYLHDNDVNI